MTMKELAQMAGVSTAAVSRYLNGGSLSPEKREQIRAVIEETGYQPDAVAQMLRTRSTDHVGLIVPKLDSDAVTQVTSGATAVLAKEGYLCLFADAQNTPEKELAYLTLFQNRMVAGIIMMATVLTPKWLNFDAPNLTGTVNELPTREDIDYEVQENMIVEFYSR